jgi:hypothetical protein
MTVHKTDRAELRKVMLELKALIQLGTRKTQLECLVEDAHHWYGNGPKPVYDKAGFQKLDQLLKDIDFSAVPDHTVVMSYIRATALYKSYLDHWDDALARALVEYEKRGIETKDIFVGLI